MNSPIVEFISAAKEKEDEEKAENKMFNISLSNIQNNAAWDLSDIICSTPTTLWHTFSKRQEYAPFNMNPAVIVFDECDTLYEEGKTQYVTNILKTFFTRDPQRASEAFIECNKRRQFIFAGSSMNNEVIDTFKKIFPGIIDLKSETFGRISPFVEH